MFLEDENAVHKLVASQYKIAPEKLMRTGGYTAPPRKCVCLSACVGVCVGVCVRVWVFVLRCVCVGVSIHLH